MLGGTFRGVPCLQPQVLGASLLPVLTRNLPGRCKHPLGHNHPMRITKLTEQLEPSTDPKHKCCPGPGITGHRGCGWTGKRHSLPHVLSLQRLQDSGWSDPESSTSSCLAPSFPEFATSSCSMTRRAQFRHKFKPSQDSPCLAVSKQGSGENSCHVHILVPLPSGVHRGILGGFLIPALAPKKLQHSPG